MTTPRLLLALLLALALPAGAEADNSGWYAYGDVFVSEPVTITGPGYKTWTVTFPEYAIPQTPVLKHCQFWASHGRLDLWDGVFPEFDHEITVYSSGVNYLHEGGTYRLTVGDRTPGRTQTYCPRWPYRIVPVEEYEHWREKE